MPRMRVPSILWIFAVWLSCSPVRGQEGPVPGAPSYADRAHTVSRSIEEDFLTAPGSYARSLTDRAPEFMWGNGVLFSSLVAATRHRPETYGPALQSLFVALDSHWDSEAPIPGYEPSPTDGNGHDKYYDDNQWMVITFAEAFDVTEDAAYLDRAKATLRFSLSGWDDALGGGIWWHEAHKDGGKNTCSNAPAAVACLRVARWLDRGENIEWAKRLVLWTTEELQDEDGLFFDQRRVADGRLDRRKFTYNSALMIRANLGLHRATGEAEYLDAAVRIGDACEAFLRPGTGAYRDSPRFTHLLVEADLELFRATGDERYLERARRNGDVAWERFATKPQPELIERASVARMLWLLADAETEVGRAFWAASDAADARG